MSCTAIREEIWLSLNYPPLNKFKLKQLRTRADRDRDAEKLLSTCDEVMHRILSPDDWHHGRAASLKGWVLTRRSKFEEAASMLIAGYERIPSNDDEDEKRKALQRLIDCYDAWHEHSSRSGHDESAEHWRSKLAEV